MLCGYHPWRCLHAYPLWLPSIIPASLSGLVVCGLDPQLTSVLIPDPFPVPNPQLNTTTSIRTHKHPQYPSQNTRDHHIHTCHVLSILQCLTRWSRELFPNYLRGHLVSSWSRRLFSLSVVFLCVLFGFLCVFGVFEWFLNVEKEVYNLITNLISLSS